jgi:hypothetical protein
MKRLLFCAAAILPFMLVLAVRAQQLCAPSNLQAEAQRVLALQEHLLAVPVQPMDETVSPRTAAQIASFKSELSAAVHQWMICRVPSTESAATLQRHLARWLDANLPSKHPSRKEPTHQPASHSVYGADLHIVVDQLSSRPRFLGVLAGFDISCGDDHLLMLYERKNHRWQRVLFWKSGKYKQISGAFGDFFDYVLLPPSIDGAWDVVTAHGTPWCTSRFSGFRIDLLQISEDGQPPRLLFHRQGAYSRNGHEPRLRATPHGFQLQIATTSLDTHKFIKTSIFRYRIQNHKVQRTQPVAATPSGFVDAWLQAPWTAASHWIAPAHQTQLHQLHATFSSPSHANSILYTQFLYKTVRRCANPNQLQVQMEEIFARRRKVTTSNELYFLLEKHDDHFHMLSVSSHPNPACIGPNLMASYK